jgi:hypothetical protein
MIALSSTKAGVYFNRAYRRKRIMKQKLRDIDKDFVSRNWLFLTRLSRMGYSPDEAKQIMRKIEAGKISFKDLIEKSQEK